MTASQLTTKVLPLVLAGLITATLIQAYNKYQKSKNCKCKKGKG